jgi:hypothetical protein
MATNAPPSVARTAAGRDAQVAAVSALLLPSRASALPQVSDSQSVITRKLYIRGGASIWVAFAWRRGVVANLIAIELTRAPPFSLTPAPG